MAGNTCVKFFAVVMKSLLSPIDCSWTMKINTTTARIPNFGIKANCSKQRSLETSVKGPRRGRVVHGRDPAAGEACDEA